MVIKSLKGNKVNKSILNKIVLICVSLFLMTGCTVEKIEKISKESIEKVKKFTKGKEKSKDLPIPFALKNISSETSISLEWLLEEKYKIDGYYIYRGKKGIDSNLKLIKQIDEKQQTHYIDKELEPNKKYVYIITTYNKKNESYSSKELNTKTTTRIEPTSYLQAVSGLPNIIKLLWRPQIDNRVKGYIIEKEIKGKWVEQIKLLDKLQVEYLDTNLGNFETYKYRIISISNENQKSDPSKVVLATTKKLPNRIVNVIASNNFPKAIDLNWKESKEKDIIKYNIYTDNKMSNILGKIAVEKIGETKNTFARIFYKEDDLAQSFYVTAVDKDDLESKMQKNPIYGKTKQKPNTPYFIRNTITNDKVVLEWGKGDERNLSFKIIKKEQVSLLKSKITIIKDIEGTVYEDKKINHGGEVSYQIIGIDNDGLESEVSNPIMFKVSKK
jgi:hypothetical protein